MIKLPFLVTPLTNEETVIFKTYYEQPLRGVKRNNLEGIWFRTQTEANKTLSNWNKPSDRRRRIVHFFDEYGLSNHNETTYLQLEKTFLYVSVSLPEDELLVYIDKIKRKINNTENSLCNEEYEIHYFKNMVLEIRKYKEHPMDIQSGRKLPDNYNTVDITVRSQNFIPTVDFLEKPWKLFKKGLRSPGIKGNPQYVTDPTEIIKYLPAQVELGCGPSIESNIPPLYTMHETYKVQNHEGQFYMGPDSDDLIEKLLEDPESAYQRFTSMFKSCVVAKPSESHYFIKEMFEQGFFVGDILSNNFDMLCERVGLKENLLRTTIPEKFFPKIEFHKDAKSLICIGSHADRKNVQLQARLKGLKVIHLDPEGYYLSDHTFKEYPLESPKDEDIVYKTTAKEGLSQLLHSLKLVTQNN